MHRDEVFIPLSRCLVLQGYPAAYKTVAARAAVRSTILRLPASAFQSVFEKYPETLVRVIQVQMGLKSPVDVCVKVTLDFKYLP